MQPQTEIQLIAIIAAVTCSLPGIFLLLKKMAMLSDSITHTVLLGIVLAFFITHNLNSPLLIVGAAVMGIITVWLTETIHRSKLLSEESSIGLVFPLLFSIAIILITRYAGSIHLDTDSVLLGELAFAPFDRMIVFGTDIGAKAIYTLGIILLLNILFITLFYKELKLSTFDAALASILGFSPLLLHYALMSLVSITAVGAFESVGSVLVVAFMIGPPSTAYLLTENLKKMIFITIAVAFINAFLGYHISSLFDVSIAGSMAVMTGISFAAVFLFSPKNGLLAIINRQRRQKLAFSKDTLLFHIDNHQTEENEYIECGTNSIANHLMWNEDFAEKIIRLLEKEKTILIQDDVIKLTDKGRDMVKDIKLKLFGN